MKIFIYIILILAGPLITILLYIQGENDMSKPEILEMGTFIYVFGFATLVISGFLHFFKANFQKNMIISFITSEILYSVGLSVYFYADKENRAENLMWLPVAAIFLILYTSPMVLLVSYSTGKIISFRRNR